jgi:hypothetical protein
MSPRPSLDEVLAAAEDAKRRQQDERIRQMSAEMSDEIERVRSEDWKAPADVEYAPETFREPLPLDWFLQEAIAKDAARGRLAEEPREPDSAGYTIYVEDSD